MRRLLVLSHSLLLACLLCTPSRLTHVSGLKALAGLPQRQDMPPEIGGTCDIWLSKGRLRARARLGNDSGAVNLAVVDELGVALVQVRADSAGI
jgi:hypothetical protein